MDQLEQYIDRLYNLRVGVTGQGSERHERPHKPVMLLAVIDLIDSDVIGENRIDWSEDLLQQFKEIFEKVRSSNDQPTPENPFFISGPMVSGIIGQNPVRKKWWRT